MGDDVWRRVHSGRGRGIQSPRGACATLPLLAHMEPPASPGIWDEKILQPSQRRSPSLGARLLPLIHRRRHKAFTIRGPLSSRSVRDTLSRAVKLGGRWRESDGGPSHGTLSWWSTRWPCIWEAPLRRHGTL